jgi:hypothetical protein
VVGEAIDIHPDVDWRQVYPGQDWRMPDGEVVHVGAIIWDGMERHALCTLVDGGVLHVPAASLVSMAERV